MVGHSLDKRVIVVRLYSQRPVAPWCNRITLQPFKLADTGSNPVRATKFMTQKQKIEQLEKEVAELKFKIALLEARPMIITVTPAPTQPAIYPVYPQPGYTTPYIGSPVFPLTTCQSGQNIQ